MLTYTARRQKILWYCDFNFIINLDQLTFKYQTCWVQNINKVNEIFLMPWTKEYTVNNVIKLTGTQQTVKYGAQGKTQSGNKDLKEKRSTAWITSVCVCVCEDEDVAVRPVSTEELQSIWPAVWFYHRLHTDALYTFSLQPCI